MQKHIIATGCLLACAATPAAAEISWGGVVNAEVANVTGDGYGGSQGWMVTDAMRRDGKLGGNQTWIGAKGSFDVGNGYQAIARARLKIRPSNWGNSRANKVEFDQGEGGDDTLHSGRDAFAGIKGSFGSVTMGTMSSPYKSTTVKWDPLKGTFMQSRGQGGMSRGQNSYLPNTLAYGNKFGGAKIKASVTFDETDNNENSGDGDGEADGEHGYSFGAIVPVASGTDLAIGYQDLGDSMDRYDQGATSMKVALRHKSGALTLVGQYESTEHYAFNYDGAADYVYSSATWAFSDRNEVILSLAGNDDTNDNDTDASGTYSALAWKHHFSGKARFHAGVIRSTSKDLDDYTGIGGGFRVKF